MKEFNYNGSVITFDCAEGEIMINLTEMAKPFGKLPADFLRLEQTQRFVDVLVKKLIMGIPIIKNEPGRYGGTWAHQKVALKFAAWLNPEFELWIYDRIEELLKNGYTKLEAITRKDLAKMLLESEEEKERLQVANEIQGKQLKLAAPKVEYYDEVLQSASLIPTTVIAKDLGITAIDLNLRLHKLGIQFKVGNTWVLYQKYQDKGFTGTKTTVYKDSTGVERTTVQTYWTEKGREFIMSKMKQKETILLN